MHRTKEWTEKRAAIEEALIVSADPVILWPGVQTQESEEDVDEEGSGEEDADSEADKELHENDETEFGREGESQEHEEGTAD